MVWMINLLNILFYFNFINSIIFNFLSVFFPSSSSTNIATSGVEGSLTDGVMTCKYTINNSELPSGDLKMGYGMGELCL